MTRIAPLGQPVVERLAWLEARASLLAAEKALTRETDRVAALRRQLPWQKVDVAYRFITSQGARSLDDLFEGRRQLIVYHNMLREADEAPCRGCSLLMDQLPNTVHLHARDTSFTVVSRAPLAEIEAFKTRMGWTVPWVETTDSFNPDFGRGTHGPGFSVLIRDAGTVYYSYGCVARETERNVTIWGLLDMTPMGRQETWQDAPDWVPQGLTYSWWRLNDGYETP